MGYTMVMRYRRSFLSFLSFLSLFPLALFLAVAAPTRASIGGVVTDAISGAPVAGARVGLAAMGASAVTDAQGRFQLPSLALLPAIRIGDVNRSGALFIGHPGFPSLVIDAAGRVPSPHSAYSATFLRHPLLTMEARAPKAAAKPAAASCILAVEATGYKPKEANCAEGDANAVRLTAESATRFVYQVPIDAGDGLLPGDVNASLPNPRSLLDLMDSLAAKRYKEVHSLLVLRGGKLVMEEYYRGNADTIDFENGIKRIPGGSVHWTRTGKHYLASVTKSLTSLAVGLALSKSGRGPSTTLASLLPEYQARFTGGKEAITVEHVLTMSLGLQWDEWSAKDLADMWATQDIGAYALAKPMAVAPGTQWIYNSAGPNLLMAGLRTAVGMDMDRFTRENLYGPLGIEDFRWARQPNGQPEGSARIFMRPRDMAKIGQMVLGGGKWNGVQVVPADWITVSTRFHRTAKPKNPYDYGYLWWMRKAVTPKGATVDYFQADGDGGQYIVVFPAQDMVVVSTGGNYADWATYDGQMGRILARHVLPAAGL